MRLHVRRPDRVSPPLVLAMASLAAILLFTTAGMTNPSRVLAGTTLFTTCDGVTLRTKPQTGATKKAVLAAGVRVNAVSKIIGGSWRVECRGKTYSGNTWYRINNVNGRSASSLYGLSYVYSVTARFTTDVATVLPQPSGSCGSSLQARIDSAPSGGTLDLTGCSYSAGATIAKPLTVVGGTVKVPSGGHGYRVAASHVTLSGVKITGPQAASYRGNEYGIVTTGSAVTDLAVRNSTIKSFGNSGMWIGPARDVTITGNTVEDTVYSGIMLVSADGGRVAGNTVRRVGVSGSSANDGNAYGIALSNTGGPVSEDVVVDGNTVETVPTWHGLDTHAGLRITFSNNTVSGSPRALFITADGSGRRATDIIATGNRFLSPSPATTNLITVTTYRAVDVQVTGNSSTGWGGATFFHDYNGLSSGLLVKNNSIQ